MQSALDSASEELRKAGARNITRMKLLVGVLSGVVPDALEFAFAALIQQIAKTVNKSKHSSRK